MHHNTAYANFAALRFTLRPIAGTRLDANRRDSTQQAVTTPGPGVVGELWGSLGTGS
jgi:hypothetical protein